MFKSVISLVVALHLIATLWHGNVHQHLEVGLPLAKSIFVYVVILVAPIVAAVLAWTRYYTAGLWLFFISMLGALLFGVYHHYVLVSPDNIGHLPEGTPSAHSQFISSAAVIALLELIGSLYGAFSLGFRYSQDSRRV
jgi:F0F1-type ATP synthase membrane subunit a